MDFVTCISSFVLNELGYLRRLAPIQTFKFWAGTHVPRNG